MCFGSGSKSEISAPQDLYVRLGLRRAAQLCLAHPVHVVTMEAQRMSTKTKKKFRTQEIEYKIYHFSPYI